MSEEMKESRVAVAEIVEELYSDIDLCMKTMQDMKLFLDSTAKRIQSLLILEDGLKKIKDL